MKISARNQISGTIVSITPGAVNGSIKVDIGGGNIVTANITEEAIADLGLATGETVTVIIKAIRDMNLPKFIAEDVILFDNLFIDLFPDCDEPENDNDDLQIAIEESLMRRNLQLNENLVVKVMQLYESNITRHGNMLVGATMAGKTTAWQVLVDAVNQLHNEEKEENIKHKKPNEEFKYQPVKYDIINPKSINVDELFGNFDDQSPPQWMDGILSNILKRICQVTGE